MERTAYLGVIWVICKFEMLIENLHGQNFHLHPEMHVVYMKLYFEKIMSQSV